MMENGLPAKMLDRERVDKYGQTALCTKGGGKIIKQMVKEGLFMLMVMSMMGNGLMIRHMDSECIAI